MEPVPPEDSDASTWGRTLGRYVVLEPLGHGAMGSVLAAYDPELGRRVALKMLRPEAVAVQGAEAARTRLLGEARALARLAHPNVVRLFDVGVHEGEVFLAMELVEGQTLRRWLAARRRPWRAVVEHMEQAGRGLAAAHALGLVHGDFKPENVLIARGDGRVRVGDFGLACGADRAEVGEPIGTPDYMAPEQHAGEGADARSDQYAWCLTLYEGLYGRRPFPQTDREALAEAKRETTVVDGGTRGSAGRIPAALRRVIRRGLAPSPRDRFPSMEALLLALHRARARATRGRAIAVTAGAMIGLVGLVGLVGPIAGLGSSTGTSSPCADAGEAPDDAWSDASRRAVAERLRVHLDAAAVAKTTSRLDEVAQAWREASRSACEATWLRKEQSPERLAARTECLHAQWAELAATVELLARAEPSVAAHHEALTEGLPAPAVCERVEPGPVPSRGADGEALHRRAAIAVSYRAERHDQAWALLQDWDAHARRDEGTEADRVARMVWRGRLLTARGDHEGGAQAHRRALELARAARDDRGEAEAWIALADTALAADAPGDARFYAEMAVAAATHAGGDPRIAALAQALLDRVEPGAAEAGPPSSPGRP